MYIYIHIYIDIRFLAGRGMVGHGPEKWSDFHFRVGLASSMLLVFTGALELMASNHRKLDMMSPNTVVFQIIHHPNGQSRHDKAPGVAFDML